MYKKITHNITEEHFAHPIAAELKKKIDKLTPQPVVNPKATITITPETQMHMHSHELFGKIVWGVRNYLTSALSGADDAAYILSRLLKDIKELSPILTTYYSKKVGDDAVRHLSAFVSLLPEIVSAAKAGKDITTTPISAPAIGHLDELATVISAANVEHWPLAVVKEYLHVYFTHVADQIISRVKKDWETDLAESTKANNVLASGPVTDGILKGMPDFANVFAEGIIKQFPKLFTTK